MDTCVNSYFAKEYSTSLTTVPTTLSVSGTILFDLSPFIKQIKTNYVAVALRRMMYIEKITIPNNATALTLSANIRSWNIRLSDKFKSTNASGNVILHTMFYSTSSQTGSTAVPYYRYNSWNYLGETSLVWVRIPVSDILAYGGFLELAMTDYACYPQGTAGTIEGNASALTVMDSEFCLEIRPCDV